MLLAVSAVQPPGAAGFNIIGRRLTSTQRVPRLHRYSHHPPRSQVPRVDASGRVNAATDAVLPMLSRRAVLMATSGGLLLQTGDAASLTLEEATPPVTPPGELSPSERAIISVFEENTTSVVNVYDVTLVGRVATSKDVETPEGNGTGIIWDKQGHVITNFHVLGNVLKGLGNNAKGRVVAKISVLGKDGYQQSYDAVLVGADRKRDLAVVKINAPQDSLRPIQLGASQSLRVGQLCLAIGNPFGFDHTLTTGAISGLGRDIQSQLGTVIGGGIQTDAAINPGNSGGPLLDSQGRVIGINTAIFTNSGTSAGVGFAIPIDTVKRTVPQLIEFGEAKQASLKIEIAPDRVARALRVKSGAMVQSVEAGSLAAKAGLLPVRRTLSGVVPGDVIVSVNGRPVKTVGEYTAAIDEVSIGETVRLGIEREGTPMDLSLTVDSA
eukprot:CAMPEP_0177760934 /NCGR_PEP_ID=MMETSP0491_2-20121128/5534_1 /TAXON_ID=63592 /ORGANISM="Tetraselmis chuii, Strain PLY429" /LENGTH=437 /DNA_ID=CAMNT_0019276871 /DNA_START=197 /DNA_END=1513 /DNA_ORIENTATION=+